LDDLLFLYHDPDLWMAVSLQQLMMETCLLLPMCPVLFLVLDYLVAGLHDFSLDHLLLLEWW
jgi:hypothetical protein